MQIYLVVFFLVTVLNFFSWRVEKLRPYSLFLSFFLLMILFTLRDVSVGIDTRDYFDFFNYTNLDGLGQQAFNLQTLFLPTRFEIGFKLYTYLVSLLTNSIIVYLFISSALIYVPIYLFIKRYSTNFYLSWVIYFCFFFFGSMSLLRQSIAMSILVFGTRFIAERKLLKYTGIVLLASSFHITALVGMMLYPLYKIRPSKKSLTFMASIAGGIFILMPNLVYLAASFNPRYEFYLDRINSFSFASYAAFALYGLIFLILMLLTKTIKEKAAPGQLSKDFYVMTSFIAMLIMGLSIRVNSLDRLSLFFMIFSVVSVPSFLTKSGNSQYTRFLKMGLVGVFVLYASISLILRPEWFGVSRYMMNTELTIEGVR